MELIAGYLCDKVKGIVEAQYKRLVLNRKWLLNRFLKRFLYDLVIGVLADVIANHILK
ncbi:MAG: hypothetical protein ACOYZ6_07295 [Chloroflexota bacterium]